MSVIKWPKNLSPMQGYPDDGDLLKKDIETLTKQYALFKNTGKGTDNEVTKLVVGQACAAIYTKVDDVLGQIVKSFKDWKDPKYASEDTPNVTAEMGPLKKIERIMQKSVHYAVDPRNDSKTLMLQRVCDILRGTIVLPSYTMWRKNFGSDMIDAVNEAFGGQVVQVKNRFVLTDYPELSEYNGKVLNEKLSKVITDIIQKCLLGRDSFYRDMALLIKLDSKAFPNGTELSHVYFELQLASEDLHDAKVTKSPNKQSGHKMYKLIRTIMEHAEYQSWVDLGNGKTRTPALANAADFYPLPADSDWEDFVTALDSMWRLYRSHQAQLVTPMWTAIDGSKWYGKTPG